MKQLVVDHLEKFTELCDFKDISFDELRNLLMETGLSTFKFGCIDIAIINRKNFYSFKRLKLRGTTPEAITIGMQDFDYTVYDGIVDSISTFFDYHDINVRFYQKDIKRIICKGDVIVVYYRTYTALITLNPAGGTFHGKLKGCKVGRKTIWYVSDISSSKEYLVLTASLTRRVTDEGRTVNFDLIKYPLYNQSVARIRF